MPWTLRQHQLFQAAAHNPQIAARVGIPADKARQMAAEGVQPDKRKALAAALLAKSSK